jgi:ParB family chromosome partitioning protein
VPDGTRAQRTLQPPFAQHPGFLVHPPALARDRTGLDPEPLRELRDSILKSGLRLPVELFPLAEPSGDHRYGIVSGFRRVAAYRELHGWGMEQYASIAAFVRAPRELAQTLAAMVEENAVRADLDGWCLHFTGKEAKSALMDRVIEEIEDIFSPRWATSRPERAPR